MFFPSFTSKGTGVGERFIIPRFQPERSRSCANASGLHYVQCPNDDGLSASFDDGGATGRSLVTQADGTRL